ncbi:MAG: hypothetical protein ABIZ81_10870, partial [Opitutaceae bacterium]
MRPPRARLPVVLLCLCATATSGFAVDSELIDALFRPFLAEQITLAPDGRHVAYTEHAKKELLVVIMGLEPPYSKVRLAVADDVGVDFSKEKKRATLRFLRWANANRLVFAPTQEVSGKKIYSPILGVDADGKNPKQ